MKTITSILVFIICCLFSNAQSSISTLQFEDYNKTTYVLLHLLEDAANNQEHQKVSVYYITLELLKDKYPMKKIHSDRLAAFKAKSNHTMSYVLSLNGISSVGIGGGFTNNEIPSMMKEFETFLYLREQGLSADDFKSLVLINKLNTNQLKLNDINAIEKVNLEKMKQQLNKMN